MANTGGGGARVSAPQLDARHHPSGLNNSFLAAPSSFSEYIRLSREMIAQARAASPVENVQRIVDGNAPFDLLPPAGFAAGKEKAYRRGVLLIHGLGDSPYFMRHLGAFFQAQGFRVMAVLLPGHGTRPGDLLDVRWQEWGKAVEFGVDKLALEADEVYLAGFSTGGALGVYQSACDQRVRGLFLFAPALRISSKAAWASLYKSFSWLAPSANWLSILPDSDIYKYESYSINAVVQVYALTRALQARLRQGKVRIPVFAAVSQDDATVDTTATVEFMARAENPANKLVYYFSDAGKVPHGFPPAKLQALDSVLPEQNIISSAHTAIVLPSEDGYYGARGEYCNCLHYYTDEREKLAACKTGSALVMLGEITEENLKKGTIRRLMYNPNFAALKSSMQEFIDGLPE